jgi:hypothetical protein
MCEEIERGFKHTGVQDSTQQVWDKEYHDEHPKWRVIGRRHGWWKCRTGPHASDPERTCELCHKPKPAEEPVIAERENAGSVSDQRMYLEKWVEERMNAVGVQDKAIGVELIHRMKPQEVLGYFVDYKVPAHELEGYDTGNDSDPDGEKEMSARPKLKPMLPLGRSTSTLDLGGKGEKGEKIEKDPLVLSRTPTASSSSSDGLCKRPGRSPFRK